MEELKFLLHNGPLIKQDVESWIMRISKSVFSNFLKLFGLKRRSARVSVRFRQTEMVSDSLITNVNHQEETRV